MSENDLILAIETSSRIGSVALARGDELLAEKVFSAPLKHSAEIFPAIFELLSRFELKPSRIEQVCISIGPGSFTGLRIAATFAKTMNLATGAQIVSVNTLDVIASNVLNSRVEHRASRIATIVDAKRGQFFVAVYEKVDSDQNRAENQNKWTKTTSDCLMRPMEFIEEFAGSGKDTWLLGDGLLYYKEKFQADGIHFFEEDYWSPRASKVYLLGRQMAARGEFSDPLGLVPNYLRGPDVKIKAQ